MNTRLLSQKVHSHETSDIITFSVAGDAGQFGISALTHAAGVSVSFFFVIDVVFVAEVALPPTAASAVDSHHH